MHAILCASPSPFSEMLPVRKSPGLLPILTVILAFIATISLSYRLWMSPGFPFETNIASVKMIESTPTLAIVNPTESIPTSVAPGSTTVPLSVTDSSIESHVAQVPRADPIPDDPFMRKYVLYESSARQALSELKQFVSATGVPVPLFGESSRKVCVGIQSARRMQSPFKYLEQTVGALLSRLPYTVAKQDVYVRVFNVDASPDEHTEIRSIQNLLPVSIIRSPLPETTFPIPRHYVQVLDYAAIFSELHALGCRYPLLLEDDALADERWYEKIERAIDQLGDRDWYVVKFYVARPGSAPLAKGLNNYDQTFNAVAAMINPKYVLEFAQEITASIMHVIAERNHELFMPIDHLMNAFAQKRGLSLQAFEPVAFQHTGVFSSVTKRTIHEFETQWFMKARNFESENRPVKFSPARFMSVAKVSPFESAER